MEAYLNEFKTDYQISVMIFVFLLLGIVILVLLFLICKILYNELRTLRTIKYIHLPTSSTI